MTASGPVLRTIRTNKYGIAKISGLDVALTEDYHSGLLRLTARNAGAVGHHTESFYYSQRPVIRVDN